MKRWLTLLRNKKGQSMVEFGLVAPIFLLSFMGSFAMILMSYQASCIYQASLEGLRAAEISYKSLNGTTADVNTTIQRGLAKRGFANMPVTTSAPQAWPDSSNPYILQVTQSNIGRRFHSFFSEYMAGRSAVYLSSDGMLPRENA